MECPKSYIVLDIFVNAEASVKRKCSVHNLEAVEKVNVEPMALSKHHTVVNQKWCSGISTQASIRMQ